MNVVIVSPLTDSLKVEHPHAKRPKNLDFDFTGTLNPPFLWFSDGIEVVIIDISCSSIFQAQGCNRGERDTE